MPHNYKRTPESRHYQDSSLDKLNQAVSSVWEGRPSARKAEEELGFPWRNTGKKLKGKHKGSVGRPIILTSNGELAFKNMF